MNNIRNNKKKLLKKALGILIHLSELSGRVKTSQQNNINFKSVAYYQSKREILKDLIINNSDNLQIFEEQLNLFQSEL
tara:strand:- start:490 stop:723 length:234 start_codon:yes stop_codon:yes gene_type:complete